MDTQKCNFQLVSCMYLLSFPVKFFFRRSLCVLTEFRKLSCFLVTTNVFVSERSPFEDWSSQVNGRNLNPSFPGPDYF